MYEWNDHDVETVVQLLSRSARLARERDPLAGRTLLDGLAAALGACQWRVVRVLADSSDNHSVLLEDLNGEELLVKRSGEPIACNGALECFTSDHWSATQSIEVTARVCACSNAGPHAVLRCMAYKAKELWCLEFIRSAVEPQFSPREQALIRVLAEEAFLAAVSGIRAQRPKTHEAQPYENLSRRQREVLELLLQGKNTKQIAATLELSVYTIQDYIKAIYRRFNVSNRAELMFAVHTESLPTALS